MLRCLVPFFVLAGLGFIGACGSSERSSGVGGATGGAGPGTGGGPEVGGSSSSAGGNVPPPNLQPVTFTPLADSAPDLVAPFRAAELWNGVLPGDIDIPVDGQDAQSLNAYIRFNWTDFEDKVSGQYDFGHFDSNIDSAIDGRMAFSFGIMPVCEGCSGTTAGGYGLSYPTYLHQMMQGEAVPDWAYQDIWVPNWNSESYLSRWEALLNALADHIASGTHGGVHYQDVIDYVDIRGYGNYGEWHAYPWWQSIPNGADATTATLERIVKSHVTAFPKFPLVALVGSFDGGGASNMPPALSYYVLTAKNDWGPFGWRRDNWGDPGLKIVLDQNDGSYMGVAFAPLIMSVWKTSPVVGEPDADAATVSNGGNCDYWQFVDEVTLYHATSFGDGNIPDPSSTCAADNVRAASKATGYRLVLDGGGLTKTVGADRVLAVELDWHNVGVAPPYNDWTVTFTLEDASHHPAWTGKSTVNLRTLLPANHAKAVVDPFNLPASVDAGTYTLVFTVLDSRGYRTPLPLAIEGRASDGSYEVGQVVVK